MKKMSQRDQQAMQEEQYYSAAAEIFGLLSSIAHWFGNKYRADFCARASLVFAARRDRGVELRLKEAARRQRERPTLGELSKNTGYTAAYLDAVLHGRRKASEFLRLRLAEMGLTTTVDGEAL